MLHINMSESQFKCYGCNDDWEEEDYSDCSIQTNFHLGTEMIKVHSCCVDNVIWGLTFFNGELIPELFEGQRTHFMCHSDIYICKECKKMAYHDFSNINSRCILYNDFFEDGVCFHCQNSNLQIEIELLKTKITELTYMPGGPGFKEVQQHFQMLQQNRQ
jgi:hypothetical protein